MAPYPFGRVASQRFRFEQYWDLFPSWGIQAHFHSFLLPADFEILYQKGHQLAKIMAVIRGFARRLGLLFRLQKYDQVFIHREITPIGPPIFEWIIAKVLRKKILYDFDDAIWLSNTSAENRLSASLKCHWKVGLICCWAQKVSCGNHFLARYAGQQNGNTHYIPTTLDLSQLPPFTPNTTLYTRRLGWTGTHSTLKYLWPIVPVLQQLQEHVEFSFLVIADKDPLLPLKNYQFVKWNKSTEWEDLAQIDIGLMPLENTEWEEGKCGFKALQYMALGIPSIVSPTGANKEIVQQGENGFVCATMEEWEKSILEIMGNEHLRQQFSEKGRKTIEDRYSKKAWEEGYSALLLS